MRTTDERMTAVRRRSGHLRQRRADAGLTALICLVALPLANLARRYVALDPVPTPSEDAGLFGASSLLGPGAGGYVLVAVVSFAVAVVVTALVLLRRRAKSDGEHKKEGGEGHHGKTQ